MLVETRFYGAMLDRIGEFANDLVALKCDVIFAAAPYAIQAVMKATSTIPIVGTDLESDPVANGWARNLGRPGGNLTYPRGAGPPPLTHWLPSEREVATDYAIQAW